MVRIFCRNAKAAAHLAGRFWSSSSSAPVGTPPQATQLGQSARVTPTNGTYFSVTPFAIWRFISARGFVSQS